MSQDRIAFALKSGAFELPQGRVAIFDPTPDLSLAWADPAQTDIIHKSAVAHAHFTARGFQPRTDPQTGYAMAIVHLGRSRAFSQSRIATACQVTDPGGLVVVDGDKTAGADAMRKALSAEVDDLSQLSKSHGRVMWFETVNGLTNWQVSPSLLPGGWTTHAGVFSADAIDPASEALAKCLPTHIKGPVADFGAGWGYLSRAVLERADVTALHLVEDDHFALLCARQNVNDPRAHFHWTDATAWQAPERLNTIVMNPPFHTGRTADPALGQAFIRNAAAQLAPSGTLWMVANRNLPYEAELDARFRTVTLHTAPKGYKIFEARAPKRQR